MKAGGFIPKQKLYIDPAKLLPLSRFLPQPPKPKGAKKAGGGAPGGRGGGVSLIRFVSWQVELNEDSHFISARRWTRWIWRWRWR